MGNTHVRKFSESEHIVIEAKDTGMDELEKFISKKRSFTSQ